MSNSLDRYDDLLFAYQYEYTEGSGSHNGDIEFYLEALQNVRGKVLELGCGTGRMTIPLKKSGVNILGMDHAQSMLEIGQKKAVREGVQVEFVKGDATSFDLKQKFSAIICPYNSISLIENRCFSEFVACIKKHIEVGGMFYFDLVQLLDSSGSRPKSRTINWSTPIFINECDVTVSRMIDIIDRPDQQCIEYAYKWKIGRNNEIHEIKSTTMYFSSWSVSKYINYFEQVGFNVQVNKRVEAPQGAGVRVQDIVILEY